MVEFLAKFFAWILGTFFPLIESDRKLKLSDYDEIVSCVNNMGKIARWRMHREPRCLCCY